MKILVFDNYDSFTYNLVHLVEKITGEPVDVVRNDQISLDEIAKYNKIILSPGPGIPSEAGLLLDVIKKYASSKSILGVCLGHQAIGEAFGGKLVNLTEVYHGVAMPVKVVSDELSIVNEDAANGNRESSMMNNEQEGSSTLNAKLQTANLFSGLPQTFDVGRYHSWVVAEEGFPEELEITAIDDRGFIMALRHKHFDVQGVQFHPESVLTPEGEQILRNWLKPL